MKGIVVGMGEALWDILPDGRKIGGAPANFAYHASQFGLNSCVASAVGNDELGNETIKNLTSKGLNLMVPQIPYPTGTVQVTLDANGVPAYDIKEGVAWDNIPFTPELEALAKDTQAVCFGSLAQRSIVSRETIHKFLNAMPNDDKHLKIFDINLRQSFYSKRDHLRIHEALQHSENQRRGTGHCEPSIRLPGHRFERQMLVADWQIQVEYAHPHVRCQRQLRVHARRHVVCGHAEGGSCRYRRCR
jgi:hypothetical protein